MIKTLKLIINISLFTVVLFLGGNYSAVYAEENAPEDMPRVIAQAPVNIKELPKTGLPLVGLGIAALFPGGLLFKKLMKKSDAQQDSPNRVWLGRQLKD